MIDLKVYDQIVVDIKEWMKDEKKYSIENLISIHSLLEKIDIKSSLKYRHEENDLPIIIHHIQGISNYSNAISRLLNFEMYLNVKYDIKTINILKKRIIKTLTKYSNFYEDSFVSKRELKKILKEYDFILILLLIQINT